MVVNRVCARVYKAHTHLPAWVKSLAEWAALTLLLLPATRLLWLPGLQTTHDGFYHKSRFLELDWLLQSGVLYPRWLPHVSFFYGSPVLHFYPPFIYYVAELFHLLGLGYLAAYEWMIGLGIVAAGWAMYVFARRWGRITGWIAALLYTYWPYHMALAYVRGAQAELWAMVWYPLILHRLARAQTIRQRIPIDPLLALLVGLLIVTHHLSAFAFMPLAFGWAIWVSITSRDTYLFKRNILSITLGLGMSTFYWLPVLSDIRYVWAGQPEKIARQELIANLASFSDILSPYWIHRYVPFTGVKAASPMPRVGTLWSLSAVAIMTIRWHKLSRECRHVVLFFLLVNIIGIIMLTKVTAYVWEVVPLIHYLQFPWRIQSIIGLATGVVAGIGWNYITSRRSPFVSITLTVVITGTLMLGALPGLRYDIAKEPRSWRPLREQDLDFSILPAYDYLRALSLREFHETWLFEYMPVWATARREDFFLPPEMPLPDTAPLNVRVTLGPQHPLRRVFRVTSPSRWTLALHQFYFPAWSATVDGRRVPVRPTGPLGLVGVEIPPGEHEVVIRYTATPAQRIGEILAAVFAVIWLAITWHQNRRLLTVPAVLLLFLAYATWPAWGRGQGHITPREQQVRLGDRVLLLGSYIPKQTVHAGERMWFALYWLALAPPQKRYKVIVHLTKPDGTPVAINDTEPGFFFTPTTRWIQGEIMEDWYMVNVPPDLAPGEYLLLTGMYPIDRVENLPMQGGEQIGGRALIGRVRILPAP